jgi:hypothetical protein
MSNSDSIDVVRFCVSRISDGPWLVLDEGRWRRVAATCPQERDARAIAALMNGDVERASVIHTEFMAEENPFQLETV